jgi:hypothetical protein
MMEGQCGSNGVLYGNPAMLHPLRQQLTKGFINWVTYLQESRYELLANGGLNGAKVVFHSGNDAANILPLGLEA